MMSDDSSHWDSTQIPIFNCGDHSSDEEFSPGQLIIDSSEYGSPRDGSKIKYVSTHVCISYFASYSK